MEINWGHHIWQRSILIEANFRFPTLLLLISALGLLGYGVWQFLTHKWSSNGQQPVRWIPLDFPFSEVKIRKVRLKSK